MGEPNSSTGGFINNSFSNDNTGIENTNKTVGGFLSGLGFSRDTFTKAIKRTKKSEATFIKDYQEMDKIVKKYQKSYKDHLKNLTKLDDYANFGGMENLFKKVIMKDNFHDGFVDKSLPILFRNYLIEQETTPSSFRKEHILRQVYYVMKKYFAARENTFIKYITVDVNKHDFEITIITIDNIKYNRIIDHNKYIINFSRTKSTIKDVLESTKKHLKRKSNFIEIDNSRNSSERSRRRSTRYGSSKSYSDTSSKKTKKTRDKNKKTKGSSKKSDKLSTKRKTKKNILEMDFGMIDLGTSSSSKKHKKHTGLKQLNSKSKSSNRRKLSILMTASEIKERDKPKNIPKNIIPIASPGAQLPTPAQLADKKEQLIASPGAYTGQPTTQPIQNQSTPQQQQDPDILRCSPITDQSTCFSSNCYWDGKQNKCKKKLPPKNFGYQPQQQLGAPGGLTQFQPPGKVPGQAQAPTVAF